MSTTITNAFQKTLHESISETNKIWIDKDNELYNTSMKSLLQNNYIKMYPSHNEGKSVVAEIFIRTLNNNI